MTQHRPDLDYSDTLPGVGRCRSTGCVRHRVDGMDNWARYLTPTQTHRSLGLVCLGVGVQTTTEALDEDRVLDCYAAVLVTRGSGVLDSGASGDPVQIIAPTLFWLRPGAPHSYGPNTKDGWTESWLLFDGPAAAGYEALGHLPASTVVQPVHDVLPLLRVLERLADTCREIDADVDVVAGSLVHEFLVTTSRATRRSSRSEDERLLEGLRVEALADLTMQDRAARLGVSTRQLRAAVRRCAGCTPIELVDAVRVNRAKSLLAGSSVPITEVAAAAGFGDPAYFSRHFRSRTGVSPREFRAQQHRFLS